MDWALDTSFVGMQMSKIPHDLTLCKLHTLLRERPLGDKAQKLIDHRRAQVIPIEDADVFFQSIQQNVQSIEEFSRPHPLSTEAAVASLKRYIAEPRYRIQLSDLIDQTIERVIELTSGEAFTAADAPNLTSESVTARFHSYEEVCSILLAMALTGSFWAEEEHYPVWQQALQRLGSRTPSSNQVFWFEELQRYPATLLLYALGLGAVEANRLHFLKHMLATTISRKHQNDMPAVQILSPSYWFLQDVQAIPILEEMYNINYAALSHRIQDTLRPHAERIIHDDNRYTLVFDKLEILMALSYAHHQDEYSPYRYQEPQGAFVYRYENTTNPILQEIGESLDTMQAESPFVTSGIFGETAAECGQGLATLKDLILKLHER